MGQYKPMVRIKVGFSRVSIDIFDLVERESEIFLTSTEDQYEFVGHGLTHGKDRALWKHKRGMLSMPP